VLEGEAMTRSERAAQVAFLPVAVILLALYLAAIGIVELVGLGESW
jgi:hypothetical protein